MIVTIAPPHTPVETIDLGGISYPARVLDSRSDEQLEELGLMRVPDPGPSKEALREYASSRRRAIAAQGISVNVAPEGEPPQMIDVSTGEAGLIALNGAALLATIDPARMFTWAQASGPATLTAAQILALGQAAGAFIQGTFEALAEIYVGVESDAIETFVEIDEWDWPEA